MTPSERDREMALKIALTDKQIGSIAAALAQARAEEREAYVGMVKKLLPLCSSVYDFPGDSGALCNYCSQETNAHKPDCVVAEISAAIRARSAEDK